jgi:hypothetical protein
LAITVLANLHKIQNSTLTRTGNYYWSFVLQGNYVLRIRS